MNTTEINVSKADKGKRFSVYLANDERIDFQIQNKGFVVLITSLLEKQLDRYFSIQNGEFPYNVRVGSNLTVKSLGVRPAVILADGIVKEIKILN